MMHHTEPSSSSSRLSAELLDFMGSVPMMHLSEPSYLIMTVGSVSMVHPSKPIIQHMVAGSVP
jgi:hypothetical protein